MLSPYLVKKKLLFLLRYSSKFILCIMIVIVISLKKIVKVYC